MNVISIISFIVCLIIAFILGGRWESASTKTQLEEGGVAISKYGDYKKIKIIGIVQEIK